MDLISAIIVVLVVISLSASIFLMLVFKIALVRFGLMLIMRVESPLLAKLQINYFKLKLKIHNNRVLIF